MRPIIKLFTQVSEILNFIIVKQVSVWKLSWPYYFLNCQISLYNYSAAKINSLQRAKKFLFSCAIEISSVSLWFQLEWRKKPFNCFCVGDFLPFVFCSFTTDKSHTIATKTIVPIWTLGGYNICWTCWPQVCVLHSRLNAGCLDLLPSYREMRKAWLFDRSYILYIRMYVV